MGKFCKMGQPAKNGKRGLVFMLSLFLFGIMLPVTAKAEQVSTDTGLCEHYTEHTAECGYVETSEESLCIYMCQICVAQAGAEKPERMALFGMDFHLEGNHGAAVKTINLDPAVLRPERTWSSVSDGGKLVYFGYNYTDPIAYRVLSSPDTQKNLENCLLLDCDTTLKFMTFSENDSNQWTDEDNTVRNWLEVTDFYGDPNIFSSIEQAAIAQTLLDGQTVTGQDTTITVPYTFTDDNAENPVSQISVMITDRAHPVTRILPIRSSMVQTVVGR